MKNIYAIELNEVSFTYRHAAKPALSQLTLKIRQGEMIGIMGPRESGKSTLCRALNGVIPHFIPGTLKGKVKISEVDTRDAEVMELSRFISVINQDFGVQPYTKTVEQEIAASLEHLGLSENQTQERIERYIQFNGLEKIRTIKPTCLSSGEKQNVIIASLLAAESSIMCFDESWFNMDSLSRCSLLEKINKLHEEQKKTTIIVSNTPEELLHVDRIVLMREGRIEKEGVPREIFANSKKLKTFDISFNDKKYQEILQNDTKVSGKRADTILKFDNVSVLEEKQDILKNINLEIGRGEFVAIAGRNGSGKTTLLKLINGLRVPSEGKIIHSGSIVHPIQEGTLNQEVAYLPQEEDHIFMETIRDEVAFGLRFSRADGKDIEVRVQKALDILQLREKENADTLSLMPGDRRKVALAKVFASPAKLFVLDEPGSLLEPSEIEEVMKTLKHYQHMGCTILMSTQDLRIAAKYAERMIILKDGKIFLDGATKHKRSEHD